MTLNWSAPSLHLYSAVMFLAWHAAATAVVQDWFVQAQECLIEHAAALVHRITVHYASMDFAGAVASTVAVAGCTFPVLAYQARSSSTKTVVEESPRPTSLSVISVQHEHPSLSLVFAVVGLVTEAETGTGDYTAEADILQVYCLVVVQV